MASAAPSRVPQQSVDALAGDLCAILEAMLAEHRALATIVERRRAALQRAKVHDLTECASQEGAVTERIAMLDRRRESLVAALVASFGGAPAGVPRTWRPNAEWLAQRLPPRHAERLLAAATALRETLHALHAANAATCEAAETVARHIQGIVRAVEQRLSGSGAYTPRGVVNAMPGALCGVDITS